MNESNCLACCNTNCHTYWEISHGMYPEDPVGTCSDMIWQADVSASDQEV